VVFVEFFIGYSPPSSHLGPYNGKRIKVMARKKKKTLTDAEIAQAVADAAEQAERGGRSSGIRIGERRFHLEG
jgi:hypothetical protein